MKESKSGDATGLRRGARGVDRENNSEFMKSFYVGKYNKVTDNARLEGDDC